MIFSSLGRLFNSRFLLSSILFIAIALLTGWATLTGYTANRSEIDHLPGTGSPANKKEGPAALHLDKRYGRLPLSFEANKGQFDSSAKFVARGPGLNILLGSDQAVLALRRGPDRNENSDLESPDTDTLTGAQRLRALALRNQVEGRDGSKDQAVVTMRLEGAKLGAKAIEGVDELAGKANYFLGNDSTKWLTDIQTYERVAYRGVYEGVDLVFYGTRQQLEYDLIVAPNADPSVIQLRFDGVQGIKSDRKGGLTLATPAGELTQAKPVIYQDIDGQRKTISGSYVIKPGNKIGFKVSSEYDRARPLVIDPTLSYLSFVNGSGEGFALTVDPTGNAYLTGVVFDANLGPTPGVVQATLNGNADCFITKLDPSGTRVAFTTYLGGAGAEYGNSIAVDTAGNVYVGGFAGPGFPTTAGAYQTIFAGNGDGFVTKLNPTGSALIYSTYFGGNGTEEVDTVIPEAGTGNLFISGIETSTDLNTTPGAFRSANKGGYDAFVAKFNSTGSSTLYLTYAGGSGFDYPISMAADSVGNVYLVGQTTSLDLPTVNPVQATLGGAARGPFKSNSSGSSYALSNGGLPVTFVYCSAINPTTPSIIYLGTDGGVFKSTDSGGSWNPTAPLPVPRVHQLTLVPGAPNTIYAGTEGGVYRSTDGGATWLARNNGLNSPGVTADVRGIAIHQSAPNTIYIAGNTGVYKSTDGGGSWTSINSGLPTNVVNALTNAIVVDPTAANTLYVAIPVTQRVFKTTNGGTSWAASGAGILNSAVRALAINAQSPSILYAAQAGGISKTTDGGTSWAAVNTGLTLTLSDSTVISNVGISFVTVDPVTPTTVYAGATVVLQPNGAFSTATVFKSLDSGGTWTAQSNGFGVFASIATIAIDPGNPATVYACTLGDADSFVLKLNAAGTTELFGTYFGGNRGDSGNSIAVDAAQNIYTSGNAGSVNFPTTGGAFQTVLKGSGDVFVAKFNAGGTLAFSTLIGGVEVDNSGGGIAVDSSNNVFVTGSTFAPDFPTTPGAFQRTIGNPGTRAADLFITKVNAGGSSLDFSSYLGGGGNDFANNFLGQRLGLDAAGNAYVIGVTTSSNFPYFDWANCCGNSAHTFVAKISSAAPSYSITGRITNAQNAGIAGVFVEAVDGQGNFVRDSATDAQGYYSLISLPSNDYTVTPQRYAGNGTHYIYAPTSRTFSALSSDQTADFTATQTYDIQGQISHATLPGVGIFDVTVTLSGTAGATTVSDAAGIFVFRDLATGNYTVTPSKPGFSFSPVNASFTSLSADQFASFTTTSGSFFTITGRAADGSNAAISNATIALQVKPQLGSRYATVQTDASGNYSFPNLQAGGNYTLMATKPLVSFVPSFQTFNNLGSNQTLNFTGSAATGLIGKIAFLKEATTQTDLATMNADGSGETSLLSTLQCSSDSGPAWSPDGAKIAFSQCGNTNREDLFVVNGDGTGIRVLTDQLQDEVFPSWSPDGTRLTYTLAACSGTDALVPDVFAISASGSLRTNLTNSSVADGISDWSPNGSTIVFLRTPSGNCNSTDTDLYIVDAVGGNERRLTTTPEEESFPAYSPDGTKIAYTRGFENLVTNTFTQAIFVMNADGTGQTQITPDLIEANRPTWSPDGSKLAFEGFLFGAPGPAQIFAVNADGTGLVQITSGTTVGRRVPAWQHYSISGRVSGNTTGVPITMTLAGTLTRVTRTDAAGNYVFGNLSPGGNYSVTPVSNAFGFSPAKADVTNLNGNQIANFVVLPAVIPAPTPPLTDDFGGAQRDPTKWNLGTQTQPLGAFDPQIPVVQQNGQLIVTPRSQTSGLHYNGYVSVNSFDFNNSKATVEVVQPAANGAETIFAIGSDLDNFSRFVVRAGATGANPQKGRQPRDAGVPQLIFQVRVGGQLTSLSIPYDPVAHRFMRFRHEPPTNSIIFETSPNNVDFTVRHQVVLQKSVSALTAELSAGTSTATDPGTAVFDNFGLVTNTFQFSVTGYNVNESEGRAVVTVTRSGDLSGTASVDYSTFDDTARQRNRYIPSVGTLSFAAGQATRTFSVLVEDNSLVEGTQAIELRLLDSAGAGLNSPGRAILTVEDNDSPPITTNPLDNVQFFVRQNYFDFLSRAPDQGGLDYWTGQFTQCGTDQACINLKRIDVSNAFYFELEFQQTGSYVYRLYRAAYGNDQPFPNPDASFPNENKKLLSYNSFVTDRARVVGGPGLAQSQLALANSIIKRPEFLATYPLSLDGPGFVDAVLTKIRTDIGVDLVSQRAALVALFNSGGRGAVIYRLADDNVATNPINNRPFIDAEYNRAFVATQYFGYLRRNPDLGGFLFWLGQVNSGPLRDVDKQHAMVCSFVTSTEYQNRFSLAVTHSNNECPH